MDKRELANHVLEVADRTAVNIPFGGAKGGSVSMTPNTSRQENRSASPAVTRTRFPRSSQPPDSKSRHWSSVPLSLLCPFYFGKDAKRRTV